MLFTRTGAGAPKASLVQREVARRAGGIDNPPVIISFWLIMPAPFTQGGLCGAEALPPYQREVAAPKGCRRECTDAYATLPQSKIGSEEPIFASPL